MDRGGTTWAAYDNLLATCRPTFGSAARGKKSPIARVRLIDPATEQKIASVARRHDDASPRPRSTPPKRVRPVGREEARASVARSCARPMSLIMRDAERLAKLITIENGKALSDSRGEVAYAAEFFRWYAGGGVRNLGQNGMAPASGRACWCTTSRPASPCW
jgi:succinate-semialdehyde dehydrogenase/glutarate-semialdehyde dehydrogenase